MRLLIVALALLPSLAFAQQPAPDRRDDLVNIGDALTGYAKTIAANCLFDARTQLAAKDAEIAKLKADLKASGEKTPSDAPESK